MESFVHLLITRHRAVWRVRILIHRDPRIRWRAYRIAEYPTPEAVVRRCIAGLTAAREKPKGGAPADVPDETGNPPLIHGIRVRWEFQLQIWA